MDETCVANTESAIAHVGSFPPPVMNVLAASSPFFLKKKLHPKSVVPTRYTPMISKSIQFVMATLYRISTPLRNELHLRSSQSSDQ